MVKIMKVSEMKELLERVVKEYLDESEVFVSENGILDWDGDGSNVGIEKNELLDDFRDYIEIYKD